MYLLQSFLILLFNLDTVELTENCVQHLRVYSVYWLAFCHASYKTRSQAVNRIAYRTASQHLPFDTTCHCLLVVLCNGVSTSSRFRGSRDVISHVTI